MAKKAVMAPMSQIASSSKPWALRASMSASPTDAESSASFMAKSSIARWRGVISALR